MVELRRAADGCSCRLRSWWLLLGTTASPALAVVMGLVMISSTHHHHRRHSHHQWSCEGALSRALARYVAGADGPLNPGSSTTPTMMTTHVNTDQPALARAMTTRQLPILPQASGDGCFGHNDCLVVMVFCANLHRGRVFSCESHLVNDWKRLHSCVASRLVSGTVHFSIPSSTSWVNYTPWDCNQHEQLSLARAQGTGVLQQPAAQLSTSLLNGQLHQAC